MQTNRKYIFMKWTKTKAKRHSSGGSGSSGVSVGVCGGVMGVLLHFSARTEETERKVKRLSLPEITHLRPTLCV